MVSQIPRIRLPFDSKPDRVRRHHHTPPQLPPFLKPCDRIAADCTVNTIPISD